MERIGTVETICRYPVKSMAGEEVAHAFVGFAGLMGDRAFAFVRTSGPKGFPWHTGREQEDLVLFRPHFREGGATTLPPDIEEAFKMAPGVNPIFPAEDAFEIDVAWLFYGKAGGGWVGSDKFTISNTATGASITGSNTNTNSGWLVGAGIEWALAPNWSVKIEYDYLGLNSQTFTAPAGGFLAGDTFTTSNPNVQTVKVGANYLFKYGVGGY
jgi:Outer membrane protein beta-barrel domain/MOSC N-terminal beta barrel domain